MWYVFAMIIIIKMILQKYGNAITHNANKFVIMKTANPVGVFMCMSNVWVCGCLQQHARRRISTTFDDVSLYHFRLRLVFLFFSFLSLHAQYTRTRNTLFIFMQFVIHTARRSYFAALLGGSSNVECQRKIIMILWYCNITVYYIFTHKAHGRHSTTNTSADISSLSVVAVGQTARLHSRKRPMRRNVTRRMHWVRWLSQLAMENKYTKLQ